MAEERFLTIAAELRARIAAGALAPGAKVPSTRALARRHRVAVATAARALQQLTREGLIEPRPRVGAVVAQPRAELTRGAIVAAAVALADAEGYDAISMRGVAGRLGAPPMSLYRHVRGKDELVARMIEAVLAQAALPSPPPPAWRDRVAVAVRAEWRLLRRHPWLARASNITRPTASLPALRYADFVLGALEQPGVDAPTRLRIHVLLHAFLQGLAVNLEEEARAQSESGISEEEFVQAQEVSFRELARVAPLPAFLRVLEGTEGFDMDFDVLFEMGLAVLLDGIGALLRRDARRPGR